MRPAQQRLPFIKEGQDHESMGNNMLFCTLSNNSLFDIFDMRKPCADIFIRSCLHSK